MNITIIEQMVENFKISKKQIENTLKLLSDGNTIPFIARYRKEATNNLNEEQIKAISEVYEYQVNLAKKKEDIIRLIDEKGLLTEEIKKNILECTKLIEIEDIYRPFKEKKKTKATDAINNGLEPLAKIIMSFPEKLLNIDKFLNDKVKTIEEAIEGAKYIIAEWFSDNAFYRKWIRNYIYKEGILKSKIKKNANDENKTYEMYYDYSESINKIKHHRVLAINRGEKESILNINFEIDKDKIISFLEKSVVKNENSESYNYVMEAIKDSLNRLILPSIEREIRSELTNEASEQAIKIFASNLENLLLTPPMKERIVLGLDPAFRTGCKLAIVDATGKFLEKSVIYPHEPKNDVENATKEILRLIDKYNVDIIAIGNGTASRESESFIANIVKLRKNVQYIIVNEAGASVYSASKIAIEEFPNLNVEERSAISIARRLQDPLAELVKVEPKSIGVGQYQHDVVEKRLDESLDFVVSKVVNKVGVNINTASASLLKYVSGLTKKTIEKILKYKNDKGKIISRNELKKLLSDKTFEQSIGFIRIINGSNILDKTSIHPESYDITLNLLKSLNLGLDDIGSQTLIEALDKINIEKQFLNLKTDIYTLTDIIESLKKPLRDLRDDMPRPILRSDILKIEDLKIGMKLQGTVRNVVDFGIFIDIGLKNDALAHISKLSNSFIKHPSELFSVGDIVDCYVDEILIDKNQIRLSLIEG